MNVVKSISRALNYVAAVFIGLMMLVTTLDVFMRYVFNRPVFGSAELVELMMILAVFPALAWCAAIQGHVRVGVVLQRLPSKVQPILNSITYCLGLSVCIVIVFKAITESQYMLRLDASSSLLDIPKFPFYLIIAVSYTVFCLVIIVHMINEISGTARK